jgi:hypothetical protein
MADESKSVGRDHLCDEMMQHHVASAEMLENDANASLMLMTRTTQM